MRRAALLLVLALAGCGGDGDEAAETTPVTQPASACGNVQQPAAKPPGKEQPPMETLSPDKTYEVLVKTNCGEFKIELDPEASPKTTASFAALAEKGFFDDTVFHRIVPGFVIQGGDPTGTGTGGPGYSTVDTPAPGTKYTRGVVAMAKAAQEAPGTAGSQFFVVTADDAGLPPDYAVIGEVTSGLDVVQQIESLGDRATEQPKETVVVEQMTLETSG